MEHPRCHYHDQMMQLFTSDCFLVKQTRMNCHPLLACLAYQNMHFMILEFERLLVHFFGRNCSKLTIRPQFYSLNFV
jgi:hypothetical protein